MAGRLVTIMLALLGCAMSLKVQLELDSNLPAAVGPRVAELVAQTGAQLVTSNADVVWSCGNTSYSHLVSADIEKLGPEGYTVRAFLHQSPQLVVAAGRAPTPLPYDRHYAQVAGRGDAYACYAALQMAGFAFLHPLTPIVPESLNVSAIANTSSSPRWPLRGFHIHTQHPLELTDLLTGFDLTANGTVLETWEAMQPDMALLAEWCLANLQNRIEWLPLWARDWGSFALGPIRQGRLLNLTKVVRGFGLHAGADAAIALQQQHAFALVNSTSDLSLAPASIASRMQWLAEAGFDFLSTENGFSEFTHPECSLMLDWINITAQQAAANQMTAYIKVHISSGQVCPNYTDPMSGGPINFNYLPIFADDRMGVMPHTVQYYNYEDPANTYGNVNFTSMFDFLFYALETNRSVVYHPETAYWINYDSSVPLFLPIYAYGRVSDLRFIKAHEQRVNKTMAGQMDFDSGWEWGYWLQDVITARSAWDVCGPADGCASDQDALAKALTPVVQPFGSAAEDLRQLLLRFIKDQRELLIFGNYSGAVLPTDDTGYVKLNGQAYMQGWDPYSEIPAIVDPIDSVQPVKLGFDAIWMGEEPDYWTKVRPLLAAMNSTFGAYVAQFEALNKTTPKALQPYLAEMIDGVEMLWLRARLLYALYDYAGTAIENHGQSEHWRQGRVEDAQSVLKQATTIVARREAAYRVPLHRVAGWRAGPTSYRFNYLWAVHSLYFWWRDYAKATMQVPEALSPCFRNLQDPVDVMIGEGPLRNITREVYDWLEAHAHDLDYITDCLDPPKDEPHYGF